MKNNIIKLSAFLLVASAIFTGCNIKEKEDKINSYDKQEQLSNINSNSDSNINSSNSNVINEMSNLTSDLSNTTTSNSTTPTKSNTTTSKSNTNTTIKVSNIEIDRTSGYEVFNAYSPTGKKVWSYKTKNKYNVGTEGYEYHDCHTNIYIMDAGKLVALNRNTGKKLWSKSDYNTAILFRDVVEITGNLYVIGGPNALEVINMNNGKTIKKIKEFKDKKGYEYSNFGNISNTTGSKIYINAQKLSQDDSEDVVLVIDIADYSFKVFE